MANRYERTRYFKGTFLVADLSHDMVLGMLFFELTLPEMHFVLADFSWKNYTAANALVATKQVDIVDAKYSAKTLYIPS